MQKVSSTLFETTDRTGVSNEFTPKHGNVITSWLSKLKATHVLFDTVTNQCSSLPTAFDNKLCCSVFFPLKFLIEYSASNSTSFS